jgi:DNA-directed RNA polymerase II subunit RPB2
MLLFLQILLVLGTGNWSTGVHGTHSAGNSMAAAVAVKTGVLQQLTNFNVVSVLSHIRRVCTPLDRVGRGSRPRQLHPSHYGYLCPLGVCVWKMFLLLSMHAPSLVETPEGPACGLIKAFALGARVTLPPSHTMHLASSADDCMPLIPPVWPHTGNLSHP